MRFNLRPDEKKLILSRDVCRLSTISSNGWPHVVPVSYVFRRARFYIPTSPKTKKVSNLKRKRTATVVIDDERFERGVMLECDSKFLDGKMAEYWKGYMRRFKHWQNEKTTLMVELKPLRKSSWFLK